MGRRQWVVEKGLPGEPGELREVCWDGVVCAHLPPRRAQWGAEPSLGLRTAAEHWSKM